MIASPILVTAQDQWRDRQNYEQKTQSTYEEAGGRFALLSKEDQTASTDARERAREDREKSDLEAQWATANWTFGQFCVSVLSFFGLGATVYFAYRAYRESRRSADIAQAQHEAETVPRFLVGEIKLDLPILNDQSLDDDPIEIAPKWIIQNVGKGIGTVRGANVVFLTADKGEELGPPKLMPPPPMLLIVRPGMGVGNHQKNPHKLSLEKQVIRDIRSGEKELYAAGWIRYEAKGHRPWRHRFICKYDLKSGDFITFDAPQYWEETQEN